MSAINYFYYFPQFFYTGYNARKKKFSASTQCQLWCLWELCLCSKAEYTKLSAPLHSIRTKIKECLKNIPGSVPDYHTETNMIIKRNMIFSLLSAYKNLKSCLSCSLVRNGVSLKTINCKVTYTLLIATDANLHHASFQLLIDPILI